MGKNGSNRRFLLYFVIALSAIIVYINSLDNAFHYDDEHDIVANAFLEKWENIPLLFTSSRFYKDDIIRADHYRPVVYVTYALNKITGGNSPFGYHVVNLAFHIGSAVMLFLIVRAMLDAGLEDRSQKIEVRSKMDGGRVNVFIALTAGLIFTVHPFNSEAVNYITARSSLMSGFFYLLAFWCWIKYRVELAAVRSQISSYFYLGSILAFLLAMLSKESAITLPVVLWLYDLYFHTPHSALRIPHFLNYRTYLAYLPFVLAVVVPAIAVRFLYWGGVAPAFKRSFTVQLYTELPVLVRHFKYFIFPVGLNIDHQTEIYKTFFTWPVAGSAVILAFYIFLAFLASRSKAIEWRVLSFFMLWFFIVLIPTIIIPLNAIFQENRGYLAVIVFTVFTGVMLNKMKIPLNPPFSKGGEGGFERLFSGKVRNYASVVILIILVLSYGAGTVYRNSVWRDGITLWTDAVEKSPQSSRAYTNLGTEYARRKMNEAALKSFMKALRLTESDGGAEPANIHYNLGTVYQQMGMYDMSVKEYLSVIDLRPEDFRPWYNLGVIYQQRGEAESAMKAYEMVITRNPSHFKSYHNIGLLYHNRGETSLAADYYRKALSINPGYARSRVNLEAIKRQEGR